MGACNAALKGPLFHGIIGGMIRRDEPSAFEGFQDRNLSTSADTWSSVEVRRFSAT